MKKLVLLFAVVFSVSLFSCGGSTTTTAVEEAPAVEAVEAVDTTACCDTTVCPDSIAPVAEVVAE